MTQAAAVTGMTIAEYLAFEETSEVPHEFHDGEIVAMSGGTYDHARVATNLTGSLHAKLKGSPCEVLDSHMRVATQQAPRFVYPDASILCGPPEFHPEDPKRTTIINPRVIFEVLSDSTEGYDRGEKFNRYRLIPTLEEYILLAQGRPLVEGFHRQDDDTWSMATWEGIDATATVRCLGLTLPLAELYPGTDPAAH